MFRAFALALMTWLLAARLPVAAADGDKPTPAGKQRLPLTAAQLLEYREDMDRPHEGRPKGVPASYDWQSRPKKDRWNTPPSGFSAITGWGQAFWAEGTGTGAPRLGLREHQTLVCHGVERTWTRVQRGRVAGAEFRPDFKDNAAIKTPFFEASAEGNVVGWSKNGTYHFWPAGDRPSLPDGPICGVLVLIEARVLPSQPAPDATSEILLGLGADYWLDRTAPWNNYKTNSGVGVGRLRWVTGQWTWFGFTSANEPDLLALARDGFVELR